MDSQEWLQYTGVNCCMIDVCMNADCCRPAVGTQKLGSVVALSVIGH